MIFKGIHHGADRAGEAQQKKRITQMILVETTDHDVQSGSCRQQIMLNDTDLPKHPENPDMRCLKAERVFHASMSSFRSSRPNSSLFLSLAEPCWVFCRSIFLHTRLF